MTKKLILVGFFLAFGSLASAKDCSADTIAAVLMDARITMRMHSITIGGVESYANMDTSKVDPVERDLALCHTVGKTNESLLRTRLEMRKLYFLMQDRCVSGNPAELDNAYFTIEESTLDLMLYCINNGRGGYRNIEELKKVLEVIKKNIETYNELLKTSQPLGSRR